MTYSELIEQLEKTLAPSRWIDARLDAMFRIGIPTMQREGFKWAWDNFPAWSPHKKAVGMCGLLHDNGNLGMVWDSESFTESLDAALKLHATALPGWTVANIGQDDRKGWHAELRKGYQTSYSTVSLAGAATPAIALCLAVLKAKRTEEVPA